MKNNEMKKGDKVEIIESPELGAYTVNWIVNGRVHLTNGKEYAKLLDLNEIQLIQNES